MAVPDIDLEPRPEPPQFTEEEFRQIPITAKGKILKNQMDMAGYEEIAETVVRELKDYIRRLFTREEELKKQEEKRRGGKP